MSYNDLRILLHLDNLLAEWWRNILRKYETYWPNSIWRTYLVLCYIHFFHVMLLFRLHTVSKFHHDWILFDLFILRQCVIEFLQIKGERHSKVALANRWTFQNRQIDNDVLICSSFPFFYPSQQPNVYESQCTGLGVWYSGRAFSPTTGTSQTMSQFRPSDNIVYFNTSLLGREIGRLF